MDKYNQKWVLLFKRGNNTEHWAVTIGQTTYYSCAKSQVDQAWQEHEEMHKLQYKKDKLFPIKYILQLLSNGYKNNPYEKG